MLRKIEAFLAPSKLDALRDLLMKRGIEGMSFYQAKGWGTRSRIKDGKPQFEERVKVEIVLDEQMVDPLIRDIQNLAGKGTLGSGKIFVVPVEDAVRLSTREAGKAAIL